MSTLQSNHISFNSSPPQLPTVPPSHLPNVFSPLEPTSELTALPSSSQIRPSSEPDQTTPRQTPTPTSENDNSDASFAQEILEMTEDCWKDARNKRIRPSLSGLLAGWCTPPLPPQRRSPARTRELVRALRQPVVRELLASAGITLRFSDEPSPDFDTTTLRNELAALRDNCRTFTKFEKVVFSNSDSGPPPTTIQEITSVDWVTEALSGVFPTIKEHAPHLVRLFTTLTDHQRSSWPSYQTKKAQKKRRDTDPDTQAQVIIMVAIAMSGYAPKSDFFHRAMGLYVHSSGVQRRVQDTLARFGLVSSYKITNSTISTLSKFGMKNIKRVANDPSLVVVYDNFNFMERVKGLGLGRKDTMANLTTCLLVSSPEVPGPFTLSQWRPHVPFARSWLPRYLVPVPSFLRQATSSIIADGFRSMFAGARSDFLADAPPFPKVQRATIKKSYVLQTPAINENEGEVSGVYRLHDKLFLDLLGLQKDDFLGSRLILLHGDMKTTSYVRLIVAAQLEASEAYERKQWLLPIPALFHILMNLVSMIFRNFWPLISKDVYGLGRTQKVAQTNTEYYYAFRLLRDAFDSRILAFLIDELVQEGLLDGTVVSTETVRGVILSLPSGQLEHLLARIEGRVFTRDAQSGRDGNDGPNIRFYSISRYLQVVRHLLVLSHAISIGDFGVLRAMIPSLPILFYGGKSSNYGPEMLYFAWLLRPEVTDRVLSDAILRSGLVRCTTAGSEWKAIDMALEHINASFALDIKNNRNSTRDTYATFVRIAAAGPYTAVIRKIVESSFGAFSSGRHTVPSTINDRLDYACTLYRNHLTEKAARPDPDEFNAPDLWQLGYQALKKDKLDVFNKKEVRPERSADQADLPTAPVIDFTITSREGERAFNDNNESDESEMEG